MTFAEEIEQICGGADKIINVVVGDFGWGSYDDSDDEHAYAWERDTRVPIPKYLKGRPQPWSLMRQYLDYKYDRSFGSPECHAIYAFTSEWVVAVGTYDGSTYLTRVPRNPMEVKPELIGGG